MSRLSYKTLFIIILFLLIPIVFLVRINQNPTKTLATWWNNSWDYRAPINIGNSGTVQTNFQIKILNNYDLSTLITAGKIQATLNDLRFVDINGESINYWIEDPTNDSVDIWGIIPSLPSGNTTIYMYYGNPSADSISSTSNITIGGTMTFVGGYRIHTFKDSGTLANTTNSNVEILVVAGGGGGAAMTGGGGGAGGLIYNSFFALTAQNYNVTVGLGGSGQIGTANPGNGSDGQNSTFDSLTAIGGGGAGTNSGVGRSGGSGGGAGHNNTTGGIGTSGQGNSGSGGTTTAPNYGAGGGGGAGAVGGTPTNYAGGNGGIGLTYSISETSEYYAGGGGGGTYMGGTLGLGGSGGGGNAPAGNATPNTGGGGGGQINNLANGGNGGSGIVILRHSSAITNSPATEETRPQGINIGGTGNQTPSGELVAYYKFDEGQGTVANNSGTGGSSINGILGTGTSSPTWTTGKNNKGLSFDGNDYTNFTGTNLDNVGTTGDFTVTAWNKQSSFSGYKTVIAQAFGAHTYGRWQVGTNGSKGFVSLYGGSSSTTYKQVTGNINLSTNTWNEITAVYSRSESQIKLYINGVYDKSTYWDSYIEAMTSNKIYAGYNNGTNSQFMNGLIDDIKIYNYALSADEIKSDYNQSSSVVFGVTNLTVGNTSNSATYCVPGSTDPCSPPVAEWKFEEGVGTTVYDTSGNNINLRIYNATPTIGKIGKSLSFTGTNSYASFPDPGTTPLDITGNVTLEAWVKWRQFKNYGSIAQKGSGGGGNSFNYALWSYATQLTGYIANGTSNNSVSWPSSNISLNQWHHISLVADGSYLRLYVDGIQRSSTPQTITPGPTDSPFSVSENSYSVNGSIDEVRVYNYARTPAQIAWDYNQGAPVAWWKFDECQGSITHDSSGIGNTGTISIGASGTQNTLGTCTVGTSAAWTAGASAKINSSLNFDGYDDYVLINDSTSLDQTKTISFWMKPQIGGLWPRILYGKIDLNFNSNSSQADYGKIRIGGTKTTQSLITSYNTWQHLVLTENASDTFVYLNGQFVDTIAATLSMNNATNLQIGQYSAPSTEYAFKGQLDDIRFYNYSLTPDQIKNIYNGGAINFN